MPPTSRIERFAATFAGFGSTTQRLSRSSRVAFVRAQPYSAGVDAVGATILRNTTTALASVAALAPKVALVHARTGRLSCVAMHLAIVDTSLQYNEQRLVCVTQDYRSRCLSRCDACGHGRTRQLWRQGR